MSMCVLGMAEEFKRDGIAVNALWPRTAPLSLTLHPHHRRNRKSNDWAFMVTETAQVRWVAAVSTAGRPHEGG